MAVTSNIMKFRGQRRDIRTDRLFAPEHLFAEKHPFRSFQSTHVSDPPNANPDGSEGHWVVFQRSGEEVIAHHLSTTKYYRQGTGSMLDAHPIVIGAWVGTPYKGRSLFWDELTFGTGWSINKAHSDQVSGSTWTNTQVRESTDRQANVVFANFGVTPTHVRIWAGFDHDSTTNDAVIKFFNSSDVQVGSSTTIDSNLYGASGGCPSQWVEVPSTAVRAQVTSDNTDIVHFAGFEIIDTDSPLSWDQLEEVAISVTPERTDVMPAAQRNRPNFLLADGPRGDISAALAARNLTNAAPAQFYTPTASPSSQSMIMFFGTEGADPNPSGNAAGGGSHGNLTSDGVEVLMDGAAQLDMWPGRMFRCNEFVYQHTSLVATNFGTATVKITINDRILTNDETWTMSGPSSLNVIGVWTAAVRVMLDPSYLTFTSQNGDQITSAAPSIIYFDDDENGRAVSYQHAPGNMITKLTGRFENNSSLTIPTLGTGVDSESYILEQVADTITKMYHRPFSVLTANEQAFNEGGSIRCVMTIEHIRN